MKTESILYAGYELLNLMFEENSLAVFRMRKH
ncbi:hypothetical protein HNP35_001638 [Flavobacterium notoginsengisoli]|uniref:Uncharacterized protein n=1 Tax=Flavobacterium notoginsengisoli TaxID=1478199 RepID=A0ABR6QBD0_9FLAO|nr:hypothetical protein [Flavobacterium notoginsengisoli]